MVLGTTWAKGRAWVENGEIVLDEDRATRYEFKSPEDSERMAFELAALPWHTRDEREAKGFVGRWGLLWHGAQDLGSGECREPLDDWWVEAGRLNFVGALYQTILNSKREGSAKPIQDLLRRWGGSGFPFLRPGSKTFDEDYITEASIVLANMINEGLFAGANEIPPSYKGKRPCRWGLATVGPGEFRLTQIPPDLLSRAYSAFAALIANNAETQFCPVCGKQFRPTPRQGPCCSSTCTSTARSRRYREKHSPQ